MKTTTYTQEQNAELLENLQLGTSAIASLRKVAGGKIQFELAERIERASGGINLLALMNKGDERFEQNGVRRAWMSAEPSQITAYFGISAEDLAEVSEDKYNPTFIWIKNPEIEGLDLRLQIVETVVGTAYEMANIDTKAKRAGKNGNILVHGGKPIFSNTIVTACVKGESPKHVLLASDKNEEGVAATLEAVAPTLD